MNLGKEYFKIKNKKGFRIPTLLVDIVTGLVLSYLLNLLWNYLAPVWGLPVLSYLQFLGSLFMAHMLMTFLGLKATQGHVHPNAIDIKEIIGEPPYGNQ